VSCPTQVIAWVIRGSRFTLRILLIKAAPAERPNSLKLLGSTLLWLARWSTSVTPMKSALSEFHTRPDDLGPTIMWVLSTPPHDLIALPPKPCKQIMTG